MFPTKKCAKITQKFLKSWLRGCHTISITPFSSSALFSLLFLEQVTFGILEDLSLLVLNLELSSNDQIVEISVNTIFDYMNSRHELLDSVCGFFLHRPYLAFEA